MIEMSCFGSGVRQESGWCACDLGLQALGRGRRIDDFRPDCATDACLEFFAWELLTGSWPFDVESVSFAAHLVVDATDSNGW